MKRVRILLPFLLSAAPALFGAGYWLSVFRLNWLVDYVVYSRISVSVLLLIAGTVISAVSLAVTAILRITRTRQDAERRKQAETARTQHRQFLLRLDHELKNPLTALHVETANLDAVGAGGPELAANIDRMRSQINRLNDLLIPMRKLAEIETRQIETAPVDMSDMLMEIASEWRDSPEGKARRISVSLPELPWPLPAVRGDSDLLFLALHNITGNAVKFTRPGDTIQIRGFENDGQVIIEIADTGPGIPPEDVSHVWEELYRGKLARGKPGSGLGLPLVRAIIEKHGGSVSLQSRVDQGTVVTLRLSSVV